jgi:nucleotide-binding universal stress UspA family protein
MGTDGPDTFLETISGSKTLQLAGESDLPILIIPNDAGFSDIKNILFAFDYHRVKQVPMKQVLAFARVTGAEITMLQIIEEKWSKKIENELLQAEANLSNMWPTSPPLKFKAVYADNHDESLKQYSKAFDADVVVIGHHHTTLFEKILRKSKLRDIVSGASYPLMLVHY